MPEFAKLKLGRCQLLSQRLPEHTLVDTEAATASAGRRSQDGCRVEHLRNNHLANQLQGHRASYCQEGQVQSALGVRRPGHKDSTSRDGLAAQQADPWQSCREPGAPQHSIKQCDDKGL